MNKQKAVLTVLALLAGLVWAASHTDLPLPHVVRDAAVGVVGVIGLAFGTVFRTLAAVAGPMAGLLRVLAVPLALGLIGWLMLRELRRDRA